MSSEQFTEIVTSRGHIHARPGTEKWVDDMLQWPGSLYEAVARRKDVTSMEGRGPAYRFHVGSEQWVIRHYRRGGGMARWLDDRYLAGGTPRPIRECRTSERVRSKGIHTPRVMIAAVYPAGMFYRGDLITEYVPDSVDLATFVFRDRREDDSARRWALGEAGRLIEAMAAQGVHHRDLNARNVLVRPAADVHTTSVIDLDRCSAGEGPLPDHGAAMLRRLERSLRKWEAESGNPLAPGAYAVLEAASAVSG